MRTRCRQSVSYALGRPISDNEADIYTARVVEALRQDAKDRETWVSRSREQRLRAVGDRMMREIPDQALDVERAKTDALIEQLAGVEAQIAAIQAQRAAPAPKPAQPERSARAQFVVTAFNNARQQIVRNPSLEELQGLTKNGGTLRYIQDEIGDIYVWGDRAFTEDEIENQLYGVGAKMGAAPGTLETFTIARDGDTLMTSQGTSAAVLLGGGRTYHQADGVSAPPAVFDPGSHVYTMGETSVAYSVSTADPNVVVIDRIDTPTVAARVGTGRGLNALTAEARDKWNRKTERATMAAARPALVELLRQADADERTVFASLVEADTEDYARNADAQKAFWQGLGFFTNRGARKDGRSSATFVRQPKVYYHVGDKATGVRVVRGSTTFHEDVNERVVAATMRLGEAANFATFLHESGHIFLEIIRDMANQPNASADVRALWADIMDWFDLDGESMPAIETAHHEMFARTFEAYLRDGKAPSISLQRIFETFRKWLSKIYEAITLQHNLNPQIASVFDRIFATDKEIAEARVAAGQETSLFRNREEAGMSQAEWDSYQRRRQDAENDARAALTATAMDAYYRQQTAWWNRQLGQARKVAAREVDSDPIRRAHDWVAYGRYRGEIAVTDQNEATEPDWGWVDPPAGLPPMTLSLPAVEEDYGAETLATLPETVRPIDKKEVEDLARRARETRRALAARNQPRRLASFVVQNGGLRDDGGDVLAILGSHRARPGLINNTNGRSIDDMALVAWEAGFFGAKPTKGNFEHYQEDFVVETNARLGNIRITAATPDVQPRLGDVISLKVNDPEADFWIVRRGSAETVGSVTREFNPEHYGVRVTRTDVMVPDYLYYALMHVHMTGAFKQIATGRTRLVNIRQRDITGLALGPALPGEPETRGGTLEAGGAQLDIRPPLRPRVYYSADAYNRPTIAQFMEALESDLRGEPVYKVEDLDEVWTRETDREMEHWFDQRGIDISADAKTLRAQILAYIQKQKKSPNAAHPDVIAAAFGIGSGDQLLEGLAAMRPRRELIEARAAELVRKEYGDPYEDGSLQDDAAAAAHRALQSRVMELELEALDRATQGNARAIARAARKLAQERVQGMTVRQIRGFERILGQERRHSRAAEQAFRRGDMVTAAIEKKAQLIAFHTYSEARNAAEGIDVADRLFRSFDNPTTRKGLDPFHLAQIDQLLEQFELRRISLREERTRQSLASYVLRMRERGLDHLIAVDPRRIEDTQRRPFGQLTWDEVQGLRDTVRNIAHLGRLKNGLLIKRETRRIQDVENAIVAQIEQNGPVDAASRANFSPNAAERLDEGRRQFHAESTKMEFLFRLLDGLQDNGPVWRHLFRPLAEAEAAELEMGALAAARLQQIFSVYSRKEKAKLFRAPRMITSIGRAMTRAEMISFALNMGNEYNKQALLAGYGWTLDQANDIVMRMDKRDLDVVQSIWDWIAEFKEPRFALHERMTGVRPQEVEATPLVTPHGVYRGGYYPVKYDARVNERTFRREAAVATLDEFGGNFVRPATKQGALIERKGSGGQIVRLDLSVLHEHIRESIHDITHREAVIDTLRLIERPAIQGAIINAVGREMYRQLRPWLADIAQEPKAPATVLEKVLTRIGSNVSIVAMGWKISTAIVQPLGVLGAVPRLGVGRIAAMVARLYGRADKFPQAMRFVLDRSAMMRHRVDTFDRDVNDALTTVRGRAEGDPVPANVRRTFFWLTSTMDMGVAIPVWMAAYEQARAGKAQNIEAADEDAAIQYADSVVRMTQGSGSMKDQSRLLRQRGFTRLFTKFMTYFSTMYNQIYTEQVPGLAIGRIPLNVFFVNMVMLWFLPAIMAELLAGRLGPEDDESEEEALKRVAGTVAIYPLMGIVGVRDVVQGAVSDYGYEISPVTAAGEAVAGVGSDLWQGEIGDGTFKSAWMAAGYWYGLPSRQTWITFDYIHDTAAGTEDPINDPASIWSEGAMRDRR